MACGARLARGRRDGAVEVSGHWWEDDPFYAHPWRTREAAERYASARVRGAWRVEEMEAGSRRLAQRWLPDH